MSTLRQGSREVRRLHRAGLGLRRSLLADTLQGLQRGELGEVAGVGARKLETYGDIVLKLVADEPLDD